MIGKIEELLNMDDYDLEAVFTPAVVNVLILDFVFTCTLLPSRRIRNGGVQPLPLWRRLQRL